MKNTFIDQLVKEGSQFIIATHSPILISYRNGKILDLNNNFNILFFPLKNPHIKHNKGLNDFSFFYNFFLIIFT